MGVGEDLNFDVARPRDVAFKKHGAVTERCPRFLPASSSLPRNSASESTTRMPRPPPPNAALTMIGKPIFFAASQASSASLTGSSSPGITGTPTLAAKRRASTLFPNNVSNSGGGPTKVIPASRHASAKRRFSDKKPYPG